MDNNYSIDLVNGIELILNPGFNINFMGNIIIEVIRKILEKAKKYQIRNIF